MEEKTKLGRPPAKHPLTLEDWEEITKVAQALTDAIAARDRGMSSATDLVRAAQSTLAKLRLPPIKYDKAPRRRAQ